MVSLRRYGDSVLKKTAAPVEDFGPELAELVEKMIEVMRREDGVGLAAPQVGVPKRIAVVDVTHGESDAYVLVNPDIIFASEEKADDDEGCLSLPGITLAINRPARITVKAQNEKGEVFTIENADGFFARALQHEIDHLNGILLIDRVSPVKRAILRGKLKKISEGQNE